MANVRDIKRKSSKITLSDGVERELKYTLNALAILEERFGSVDEAFDRLDKNSVIAMRCVIWAGLIFDDKDITEEQVGNLIDLQYMDELVNGVSDAMSNDMPLETKKATQLPNA